VSRIGGTIGAVLAGGAGRRFGGAKCLAMIDGETLLERVLSPFRQVFEETVVVAREVDPYAGIGARVITDAGPRAGPLGGIHAGLEWALERGAAGICCAPCDAPFLQAGLLERLSSDASGAAAVLPRSGGPLGFEPLFAWYSCETLPVLKAHLGAGALALHEFVAALPRVRYLSREEVAEVADPRTAFFNVNTLDDLALARRRLQEGG
jgi:molybdenum cofactor guanylyltransferase